MLDLTMILEDPNARSVRQRRHHCKSRGGCLECRRRRVKCDETKPACKKCVLGLNKCIYALAPQSGTISSTSSTELPHSRSVEEESEVTTAFRLQDSPISDLYRNLLHCSNTPPDFRSLDYTAFRSALPALARQSEIVLHSLLAISAANQAWTMVSGKTLPDKCTVNQTLLRGYRHFNEASSAIRRAISSPGLPDLENVIASALILVPFTTSTQQINHWLSKWTEGTKPLQFLSSTPRDVIVMIRGIRTMLEMPETMESNRKCKAVLEEGIDTNQVNGLISAQDKLLAPNISGTSEVKSIISMTSRAAFARLDIRLNGLLFECSEPSERSLMACNDAFGVLDQIRNSIFSVSEPASPQDPLGVHTEKADVAEKLPPWLHSFVKRSYLTDSEALPFTTPLTHLLLSFYAQVPQAYLDLVLPLLDQRLQKPIDISPECMASDLTQIQALALDIYAHWSVLMILVEDQSWWIGPLPEVTLAGMVNRYGSGFVGRFWEEASTEIEDRKWWPGQMLAFAKTQGRGR